jgi:hypothetical protein
VRSEKLQGCCKAVASAPRNVRLSLRQRLKGARSC